MSKGKKKKNREHAESAPDRDDGAAPELRSREEVAREIGTSTSPTERSGAGEALQEDGPLRLDKSGALVGRPKLKPVRAHRREAHRRDAQPGSEDEAAPSRDEPGDTGAAEPSSSAQDDVLEAPLAGEPFPGGSGAPAKRAGAGPRKASLPPRIGTLRPEGAAAEAAQAADEIEIPGGTFLFGETQTQREVPAFRIDRRPVTNADYETFVVATGHRPPLYWGGPVSPEVLVDHPVVGIDYYDALAYAQWKGKDLPYEDEWERAARGTDGRTYPWGNDQELTGANTARVGLRMTVPTDLHKENVSPDGCLDMVGNAWELTHSPAPGGGVVVRGGSWYDFALYAKTFFRFASRPDARNGTIGFRCCVREEDRADEPREVSAEEAEAEIAARRGPEAPVDKSEWSVERRDLVLDLPRLRTYVAEARAESLLGTARAKPGGGLKPAPVPQFGTVPPEEPPEAEAPRAWEPITSAAEPKQRASLVVPPPDEPARATDEEPPVAASEPDDAEPDDAEPDDLERDDLERDDAQPDDARIDDAQPDDVVGRAAESKPESDEAESEAALPRIHVGGDGSPAVVDAGDGVGDGDGLGDEDAGGAARERDDAMAWERTTEEAVRSERALAGGARARSPQSMPMAMWVLLGAGFLLFGGLLVVLVNRGEGAREMPEEPPPVVELPDEPRPEVRSPLADLPDMPDYDAFPWASEPARIYDAARREDAARFDQGTWLLVFVDPEATEAEASLRAAHAMHRRLATHDVGVAVVLPRTRYQAESGALEEAVQLADHVKADGRSWLWDGIPAVLEPVDGKGRGLLRLRWGGGGGSVAAVLVNDGVLESRTLPPPGGYSEVSLVRLAKRALQFARDE